MKTAWSRGLLMLALWGAGFGAASAATERHEILVLHLAYDGGRYQLLEARVVESSQPLRAPRTRDAKLHYALVDGDGATLVEHAGPDPRVLRAPLSPPGAPPAGHDEIRRSAGEFVLRLPYRAARALRLREFTANQAKPAEQLLELPAAVRH